MTKHFSIGSNHHFIGFRIVSTRIKTVGRNMRRLCMAFAVTSAIGIAGSYPLQAAGSDLKIGGTGAALGIAGILLDELRNHHPDMTGVVLPSLGSGGGVRALAAGAIDIAFSSRPLKDKEKEAGLRPRLLGVTPVVVAVGESNPQNGITIDALKAMLSGDINSWENGAAIRFVLRPPTETDVAVLFRAFPGLEPAWGMTAKRIGGFTAYTDQQNAETIEPLPGAIGLSTLVQIVSEKRSLKALVLDGVTPSTETIATGKYPLVRDLFIVTRRDPDPAVQAYLDLTFSAAGREMLMRNGLLPKAEGK
jgi:phosphate transport system substrate-binding protein